jgi:hypothetical protein
MSVCSTHGRVFEVIFTFTKYQLSFFPQTNIMMYRNSIADDDRPEWSVLIYRDLKVKKNNNNQISETASSKLSPVFFALGREDPTPNVGSHLSVASNLMTVSLCLSLCLSVCLSVYISICLQICLSVRLSVYLCMPHSFCFSLFLSPACLYVHLCVCFLSTI